MGTSAREGKKVNYVIALLLLSCCLMALDAITKSLGVVVLTSEQSDLIYPEIVDENLHVSENKNTTNLCVIVRAHPKRNEGLSALLYSLIDGLSSANSKGENFRVNVILANIHEKTYRDSRPMMDDFLNEIGLPKIQKSLLFVTPDLSKFNLKKYKGSSDDYGYAITQFLMDYHVTSKYLPYTETPYTCDWSMVTDGTNLMSRNFLSELHGPMLSDEYDLIGFDFLSKHATDARDGTKHVNQHINNEVKKYFTELAAFVFRIDAYVMCEGAELFPDELIGGAVEGGDLGYQHYSFFTALKECIKDRMYYYRRFYSPNNNSHYGDKLPFSEIQFMIID
eukprot:CAMPEP_0194283934 /NCGR_PEP_ID=MMETSP0169-20130528/26464_1 /TAXON_ID=218684 /ORGANISM="Corethron pennatum, Strain L29A3" /LENGTH=336 /DNA_ID=CAMNT_0039029641 /DNA_START=201 /DNA_END=1212 /DNA_ORIENTATION=+